MSFSAGGPCGVFFNADGVYSYYALIVAVVTFCYLYITVRMAQWRADIRREMVNKSREEDAVKNDSMVAYETVKYFNAEAYEFNRYRSAVRAYQKAENKVLLSLNVMNVTQNLVFTIGLVIACFLSAWQVTTGQVKVGRFVSLLAYLAQLQGPLNFFGTFYRSIQSSMINSERMLELVSPIPGEMIDWTSKLTTPGTIVQGTANRRRRTRRQKDGPLHWRDRLQGCPLLI